MMGSDIARTTRRSANWRRTFVLLAGFVSLVASLGACDKGLAFALVPDFSGVWDVTYDDELQVRLELGDERVVRDTLGEQGGSLSWQHDASVSSELAIDCTRPELVCPSEVWPRELVLRGPPGKLDGEGVQLAQSLVGRGQGRCAAVNGSVITGEVMTVGVVSAVRPDAVALTSGRIQLVLDGSCFGAQAELPKGARVILTAGYTAAKR